VQSNLRAVNEARSATPLIWRGESVRSVALDATGGRALLGDLDPAACATNGPAIQVANERCIAVAIGTWQALGIEKQLRHA